MVLFGTYPLPHVLDMETTRTRMEIEKPAPYRNVPYRIPGPDLGRTVVVTGEIRSTTIDAVLTAIEQLRALNDGTKRTFDPALPDASTFTALLVDPDYSFVVDTWIDGDYRVPYSATFLEVAA